MIQSYTCRQIPTSATTGAGLIALIFAVMFQFGAFFVSTADAASKKVTEPYTITLVATTTPSTNLASSSITTTNSNIVISLEEERATRLTTILLGLDGLSSTNIQSTSNTIVNEKIFKKKQAVFQKFKSKINAFKASRRTTATNPADLVAKSRAEVIKSATGPVTITANYNGSLVGTSNSFTVGNGTICTASLAANAGSIVVSGNTIPVATSSTINAENNTTGTYQQSGLCAPENPALPEPYLISPGTQSSPGTQYSTTTLQFKITPVTGATSYEMYLRNIATNALYIFPMTGTTIGIQGLGFNSQWRWNAAAKGSDGKYGWVTDVNYFTTAPNTATTPTFSLTPATQTIASGGTASLVLSTTFISSCTLSGGGYNNTAWGSMVNGTLNIPNISTSATYSIACLAQNGTTLTRVADVVVSATAPKATFSIIGSQVTGTVFPLTITTANIPTGAVIDLTVSGGTLHTNATTQYPITYTKNVTLSGTNYAGSINVTSVTTGARTLTARYNGAIVGTSNSFTLTAPCTSSLSSLAEASGESFALESICTPTNPSLLPPTQVSPGVAQSTTQPNGTTVGATTQTFSWNAVSGASKYALYVRNLDTDVLEVNSENVTGTSFTTNVLKAGAKYKWNVRAIDSTGKGGWISDGLWFTVQAGIVETPLTGSIKLTVVDETNDPITNIPIQATCYTLAGVKCADQTQLQLLNPITDAKGTYLFYKNVYSSYETLKTSVTVNGVTKDAVTEFSFSVAKEVFLKFIREVISDLGVLTGLVNGAYQLVEATYQVVWHPFETINGLYVALSDLSCTSNAVYEGLKGRYVEIVYVDVNNYVSIYNGSKAFGQTTFDACTVGCTAGAGVVVKGIQLGKVAVDVSATADKAATVAKITKVLKDANISRVVTTYSSATKVDDIAIIAKANRINSVTESAYVVPGNKEAALQIAEKFGWTKMDGSNANGTLFTYTSPDGLQRITYREFSTSLIPNYKLEATLDLLKYPSNGAPTANYLQEIKFVTK